MEDWEFRIRYLVLDFTTQSFHSPENRRLPRNTARHRPLGGFPKKVVDVIKACQFGAAFPMLKSPVSLPISCASRSNNRVWATCCSR